MTFEVHSSVAVMLGRHRWSWLERISLLLIVKLALVRLGEAQKPGSCCEEEELPECGYMDEYSNFSEFSIQPNGDLLLLGEKASNHTIDEYCNANCHYNLSQSEPKYVVLCTLHECWWKFYVLDLLFLSVSSVFLAVSFIVYVSVAELRRKESNYPLTCMLSAQFFSFTSTLAIRLLESKLSPGLRRLSGLLNTFAILSSFSWLNVISYQVKTSVPQLRARSERNKKKWWLYSLYGWGFPLVWTTVTGAMDLSLPEGYFKDQTTVWFYRNGLMLLMMLVNLYFFVHLMILLVKQFQDIDQGLQTNRRLKDRYKLFIRLFMVMGIAWCVELFTHTDECHFGVILCEVVVELQGLWIFLVSTCAKNNRRLILRPCGNFISRFSFVRGCVENRQRTTKTQMDSGSTSNTTSVRKSVSRITGSTQLPDVPCPPCISSNVDIFIVRTLSNPPTSKVQENSEQTSAVTNTSLSEKAISLTNASEADI
ncbi:G-protein coupled receptor Mth2-like isoform X2 [Penaeus indicus]|uniref:G-protein coupled receptor Mth2-like isoform X2 n=1 Tax=Penaeus indicus TaxID=29960 RepID=UPI00300C9DE9